MSKIKDLWNKTLVSLYRDGPKGFLIKAKNYTKFHMRKEVREREVKDILFINGCTLPHPERYRVDHQMEQLAAAGMKVDKAFVADLTPDLLKYYRGFVIFRCPITPQVAEFIEKARYFNKRVFFDVDDLVINRKYTDTNEYVQQMKPREKWGYDNGVMMMEDTLKRCDYLITSTDGMKKGLAMYGKETYVNRNVASEEMVKLSLEALEHVQKDDERIVMGYLSGSISHNPDMEMMRPAIVKIMEEYENVDLLVAGFLDIPEDFKKFEDRIKVAPFSDWRGLPATIAKLDINLAPLKDTIFNEAKSENKWTEAGLCKVVTVASDLGAFKDVIEDGKTGVLCKTTDEWYEKIKWLIENPAERQKIAERAHEKIMQKYVTTYTGSGLMKFIESKLAPNVGMVLPSTDVSGGIMVAVKHCHILREHGCDVLILSMDKKEDNIVDNDGELNVVCVNLEKHNVKARFRTMVATLYTTLDYVKKYPEVRERVYLVQGKETDFYEYCHVLRGVAESTYNEYTDIKYATISAWCKRWLHDNYEINPRFAHNGIEPKSFGFRKREFRDGEKIRILIEGDSRSYYKNIDESFKIVEQLDKDKYEIIYLSYQGEPKTWYKVDKFYHKVPHDEVSKVYEEADILLKSSMLESFSYPPLEMMATGGFVVVAPNPGNVEYLKNEENCLFYKLGNANDAVKQIERLSTDVELRRKLERNAKETVKGRSWSSIEKEVASLYGVDLEKRKAVTRSWIQGNNAGLTMYAGLNDREKLIRDAQRKGKKIAIYLVENKMIAQFRYRCQNPLETTLESEKWQAVYYEEKEMDALREILPNCNLFIIERKSIWRGPEYELVKICRQNNIRILYDIDDLVFDVKDVPRLMKTLNSKNILYWMVYVLGVRKIAKRADGFLVTNDFLGERVKNSLGKPYKVIRNSLNSKQVEVSAECRENKLKENIFRIGYFSGTPTHVNDFRLAFPELRDFLDKYDDTVLEIVGFMQLGVEAQKMMNQGKIIFSPPVDFIELQRKISAVDINIAPLLENDFTNCKSELKFFEAAVVDTPTIASPTYTFKKAIKNGVNGYLAEPGQWGRRLEELYNDAHKRKEITKNAREFALKEYYGEVFLREVEEAYDYFAK